MATIFVTKTRKNSKRATPTKDEKILFQLNQFKKARLWEECKEPNAVVTLKLEEFPLNGTKLNLKDPLEDAYVKCSRDEEGKILKNLFDNFSDLTVDEAKACLEEYSRFVENLSGYMKDEDDLLNHSLRAVCGTSSSEMPRAMKLCSNHQNDLLTKMLKSSSQKFINTTEWKKNLAHILVPHKQENEVLQKRFEDVNRESQEITRMIQDSKRMSEALDEKIEALQKESEADNKALENLEKEFIRMTASKYIYSLITKLEVKVIREKMPQDSFFADEGTFKNTVAEYVYKKYGEIWMSTWEWRDYKKDKMQDLMTEEELRVFEASLKETFKHELSSDGTTTDVSDAIKRFCKDVLWGLATLKGDGNYVVYEICQKQMQDILDVVYCEVEEKIDQCHRVEYVQEKRMLKLAIYAQEKRMLQLAMEIIPGQSIILSVLTLQHPYLYLLCSL